MPTLTQPSITKRQCWTGEYYEFFDFMTYFCRLSVSVWSGCRRHEFLHSSRYRDCTNLFIRHSASFHRQQCDICRRSWSNYWSVTARRQLQRKSVLSAGVWHGHCRVRGRAVATTAVEGLDADREPAVTGQSRRSIPHRNHRRHRHISIQDCRLVQEFVQFYLFFLKL